MINSSEDRPHAIEIEAEPKFRVEIITAPDELIDLEIQRVLFYLGKYDEYRQKGYGDILRFPDGIDPVKSSEINVDDVRCAIKTEFAKNKGLYKKFAGLLFRTNEQIQTCIPVVEELYGFELAGVYRVAPAAYGTVGSAALDPIYFRLPELRPPNLGNGFTTGKYRSSIEILTHEILAHKVTARVRANTTLDELAYKATHQQHKEYLMDLLGRTILTRSDLMRADDVAMQVRAMRTAQKDIDPLYFDANGDLSWVGDLRGLVFKIDRTLKGGK